MFYIPERCLEVAVWPPTALQTPGCRYCMNRLASEHLRSYHHHPTENIQTFDRTQEPTQEVSTAIAYATTALSRLTV